VVSCKFQCSCRSNAYNNARDAVLGVVVALQVLRDCDEDTGGERHVEDAVVLLAALLELLEVLLKLDERLVLVVLAGNVRAVADKLLELLLQLLCGGLDVRLDALEVLLVVHLCARISDDANILGKEVVAVLENLSMQVRVVGDRATHETEERRELYQLAELVAIGRLSTYGLLLRQITGRAEDYNGGVVLELLGATEKCWSASISPWLDVHSLCVAVAVELPLQRRLTFLQAPARTSTRDGIPRKGLDGGVQDIKGCKQAHIPGIGINLRLDHGVRHGDIAGGELRLGVLRGALGWGNEQLAGSRCIEGGRRMLLKVECGRHG
jgi:hypothetical protein